MATFTLNGQLTAGVLTDQIKSNNFAIPDDRNLGRGDLWAVNARFDVGTRRPPTRPTGSRGFPP